MKHDRVNAFLMKRNRAWRKALKMDTERAIKKHGWDQVKEMCDWYLEQRRKGKCT